MTGRHRYSFDRLIWIAEQLTKGRTQADIAGEVGVSGGALCQTINRHLSIIWFVNEKSTAEAEIEIERQESIMRFDRKKFAEHVEQRNKFVLIPSGRNARA